MMGTVQTTAPVAGSRVSTVLALVGEFVITPQTAVPRPLISSLVAVDKRARVLQPGRDRRLIAEQPARAAQNQDR